MFQLTDVTLNGTSSPRLNNVTLPIDGRRTAVVGYSGAGKTSLLNVLAGFELPNSGSVRHDLEKERADRLPLYWVPQNGGLWPHLTVDQHLESVCKFSKSSDEILIVLGLVHRRTAYPAELSQGERSRLALARALATRANVLLMDEPLSHVDPVLKPTYWKAVAQFLARDQMSVIFSSHEPETVLRQSDSVICMHEGRVVFHGATRQLYESPANSFLGAFLGPLNWFEPDDAALFLSSTESRSTAFGIRPERLVAVCDEESPVSLVDVLFQGATVESVVKHIESGKMRTVVHQAIGRMPQAGHRIRLQLR
jgi:ABC-type Fe3+/spermidine/putrescine transport system ATPase subunit